MIGNLGLDQFDKLPLWGQVLVAARLLRRRALAVPPTCKVGGKPVRDIVLQACDGIDQCCTDGSGTRNFEKALQRGVDLQNHSIRAAETIAEATYFAVDACRAAEAAYDFPVDGTVTASATKSIAALNRDPQLSTLQLLTLIASDIDLLKFACGESSVGKYDGLSQRVMGYLPPVHPLNLGEKTRSAEDEAR